MSLPRVTREELSSCTKALVDVIEAKTGPGWLEENNIDPDDLREWLEFIVLASGTLFFRRKKLDVLAKTFSLGYLVARHQLAFAEAMR